jgi:transposase InsO family protein
MKNDTAADPLHLHPMYLTKPAYYTLRTIPYEYRNCEEWPSATVPTAADIMGWFPDLSKAEAEDRATQIYIRFNRLQRAIKVYMSSGSLKPALQEAQCSKKVFYHQFNRCLLPNPITGEGIAGWSGLIRQLRLKSYTRVNDGPGTAGQFQKWLRDNPAWKEILNRMIEKGNGGKRIAARKPDVRSVTKNFIAAFSKPHGESKQTRIPLGTYPNDGKSNARRSIERYINHYITMNPSTTAVWFGEDVAKRQHLGTGPQSFNLVAAPFDVLGCDAHTLDAIGFIILDGESGVQKVPVTRIQIVATLCHFKRVVTGYSVCIRPQIQASHVEEAYLMGHTAWKPRAIAIEGLRYAEGAGFPNGVVEGITEINPALLRLDNAAQHFATAIRSRLRESLGCAIAWGGVGHWWRNAITERFFGTLERYGFQRLPSTMGTGTQDRHRSKNPVTEAVGKGIEWHELVDLVDVLIANYNAKPHSSLGSVSPLDSLRASMTLGPTSWTSRILPPHTANSPRIGVQILRRKIGGSVKNRIAPYVEIGEERYTAGCLSSRPDLIGRHVHIHLPRDIRTAECYLDTGQIVGEINCMNRGWMLSAHTLQTRQIINSLIRKSEMWVPEGGDPISAYLVHLETKAISQTSESHKTRISADASAVADCLLKNGVRTVDRRNDCDVRGLKKSVERVLISARLPPSWE